MVKIKEFSENERLEIISLHSQNISMRQIAKQFQTNHRTVGKIIKKKEKYGTVKNIPGRGPKYCTTARTNRHILKEIGGGSKITIKQVKENLNLNCSFTTIRRRLHGGGYWGRIARRTPCLTEKHKAARLKFAKDHIDKNEDFWSKVIWSDESKFELFGSTRRQTVWRKNCDSHKSELTQATVKHSKYIMVWGCFSALGLGHLTEICGKMNAEMYKNTINEHLFESASEMGILNDFIFQQDNDPKHTSRLFKSYIKEKGIMCLSWPSQSPDLNPIENLWDELDRRILQIKRKSFSEFKTALFSVWSEIGINIIQNLIKSMPKRLKLVIDAKGGAINY